MALHPIFKIREEPTSEVVELLDNTVLGTSGAQYRHLDTKEKIAECDNPLFLSMERHIRVLGNITFCRRSDHWYIRYFAFDQHLRSAGKAKSNKTSENFLKKQVEEFFQEAFNGSFGKKVSSFYAYVDPKNVRSLWMTEAYDFKVIGTVATQSFSRINPYRSERVEKIDDWNAIKERTREQFSEYQYYFEVQTKKPPFYILKNEDGKILASAKIQKASWQISRLPGKLGGLMVKLLPYLPLLNKLIKPEEHNFLVVEAVTIESNDPKLMEEFFSGMLEQEKLKLLFWWVDEKDPLYASIRKNTKWGLLHRFIGAPVAQVVCRRNPNIKSSDSVKPVYTVGLDFI